jgi:hypothetical protein
MYKLNFTFIVTCYFFLTSSSFSQEGEWFNAVNNYNKLNLSLDSLVQERRVASDFISKLDSAINQLRTNPRAIGGEEYIEKYEFETEKEYLLRKDSLADVLNKRRVEQIKQLVSIKTSKEDSLHYLDSLLKETKQKIKMVKEGNYRYVVSKDRWQLKTYDLERERFLLYVSFVVCNGDEWPADCGYFGEFEGYVYLPLEEAKLLRSIEEDLEAYVVISLGGKLPDASGLGNVCPCSDFLGLFSQFAPKVKSIGLSSQSYPFVDSIKITEIYKTKQDLIEKLECVDTECFPDCMSYFYDCVTGKLHRIYWEWDHKYEEVSKEDLTWLYLIYDGKTLATIPPWVKNKTITTEFFTATYTKGLSRISFKKCRCKL